MALEMHAHHFVPVFFAEADEHAVAQHPGVVHHGMDFAEARHRGVDDFLCRGEAGDVLAAGQSPAPGLGDFVDDGLRGFGADVVDHDVGALGGKCQRIGAAETGAGAGDDDGAIVADSHFQFLSPDVR